MKLYYATVSPFSRKARIVIAEKGLLSRIEMIAVSPFDSPAELISTNPLGKVPALVREDRSVLFDSPVICEFLDQLGDGLRLLPPAGDERWTVLRRQALTDGMMDATFNIACEINRRPENERSQAWIDRWLHAIRRSLRVLEDDIGEFGTELTLAHVGAGCALSYLDLRAASLIDWRKDFPVLAQWHQAFSERPSMQGTRPDA